MSSTGECQSNVKSKFSIGFWHLIRFRHSPVKFSSPKPIWFIKTIHGEYKITFKVLESLRYFSKIENHRKINKIFYYNFPRTKSLWKICTFNYKYNYVFIWIYVDLPEFIWNYIDIVINNYFLIWKLSLMKNQYWLFQTLCLSLLLLM